MGDPIVSVLLAVTHSSPHAGRAIASILAQTFNAVELVVAAASRGQYAGEGNHPSVRWCAGELEDARGALLIRASEAARGSFLCWVNPGAVYSPLKIEKQLKCLGMNPTISAVSCGVGSQKRGRWFGRTRAAETDVDPCTLMIARHCFEAIGGFNPNCGIACEAELIDRLAGVTNVAHVDEPLVWRRKGGVAVDIPIKQESIRE